jgi:hypothetical protein
MKEKCLGFLTFVMIVLSVSGFTYAHWNDVIIVNSIMSFGTENMGFVEPKLCVEYHEDPLSGELVLGEYLGKDVGKCSCEYQELKTDSESGKSAYKKLIIVLSNAYPGYITHCNFTLEDIGTLPIHITNLVIFDPNEALSWDPEKDALVDAEGTSVICIIFSPEPVCTTLQPSDNPNTSTVENKEEFEMSICIMQSAQECTSYSFEVEITYEVIL